ncbi:MAG TPA: hypothetical protein VK604_01290 [Bryobacteraceae bacterium]|nr:hypothetical protein [Bryobacteraceae bacterium]
MSNKSVRILFAIWLLIITCLSLFPLKLKVHLGTVGPWHNTGHLLVFVLTTVLACWTVSGIYARLLCCIGVAGIAMTLEWLETLRYHNPYEWRDVGSDTAGILIGFLVMLLLPAGSSAGVKRAA